MRAPTKPWHMLVWIAAAAVLLPVATACVDDGQTPTLTVTITGTGGTVTPTGTSTQDANDEVEVTATWNDATHDFEWGGDCEDQGSICTLTMDEDKTVTGTFTALSATRCSNTNDANCIRAVYIGAPGDYRQLLDVPAAMKLNAGPGGTYFVDADLQVTVVTAARLPAGWTRFYLDQDPVGDPPISASRLIPPVGTTYTFTVSEEAAEATDITYELKRAKPFVRPRPDGKPEIGATVVETEFEVQDCSSGIAVTNPATNTELVGDCESLLGLRERIRGSGALNWTAGKAMSDWMGVTVSGDPKRVTTLDLSDLGLDGELSGLLGNLTGLTTLDLSGNALTGRIPSKLGQLTSLTSVKLSGTDLDGCAPRAVSQVTSDVTSKVCGPPAPESREEGPIPAGTYKVGGSSYDEIVYDLPADSGIEILSIRYLGRTTNLTTDQGTIALLFRNAEKTFTYTIDAANRRGVGCTFTDDFTESGKYTRSHYENLCELISESLWGGN